MDVYKWVSTLHLTRGHLWAISSGRRTRRSCWGRLAAGDRRASGDANPLGASRRQHAVRAGEAKDGARRGEVGDDGGMGRGIRGLNDRRDYPVDVTPVRGPAERDRASAAAAAELDAIGV